MQTLQYIFLDSTCFTTGKFYQVRDSEDIDFFITFDDQNDEIYAKKTNFKITIL